MLKSTLRFSSRLVSQLPANKSFKKSAYPIRAFSDWKFKKQEENIQSQPIQKEEEQVNQAQEADPNMVSRSVSDPELIEKYIEKHQERVMPKLWTVMTTLVGVTTKMMLNKYNKKQEDSQEEDEEVKAAKEDEMYRELQLLTVEMKDQMNKKKKDLVLEKDKKLDQIKGIIVEKKPQTQPENIPQNQNKQENAAPVAAKNVVEKKETVVEKKVEQPKTQPQVKEASA